MSLNPQTRDTRNTYIRHRRMLTSDKLTRFRPISIGFGLHEDVGMRRRGLLIGGFTTNSHHGRKMANIGE
jgi:hypothetical protein